MTTSSKASSEQHPSSQLLHSLLRELFQTERSATEHPPIEADRLGRDTTPAKAMLAVAAHAQRALASLPALAEARGFAVSAGGLAAGKLFSVGRDLLADLALNSEQTYRGTLLGIHHGVDLVTMLKRVAVATRDQELADWCDAWLPERTSLMNEVRAQLDWFARNPEQALQPAKPGVVGAAARAVMLAADKVEDSISRSRPSH